MVVAVTVEFVVARRVVSAAAGSTVIIPVARAVVCIARERPRIVAVSIVPIRVTVTRGVAARR